VTRESQPLENEDDSPFARLIGLKDGRSDSGVGTVSMTVQPHHLQSAGNVHGGLIAVLADTAFFRAVRSLLAPGDRTTTVEMKVNFLAPASGGELTATATVVSSDNRLVVAEVEVTDQDQTLIAQGLGTYLVMRRSR
jgi:uncharacterized protein (TIGR00369 family)